ncbi:MAG: hypothetical protein M5U09_04510, partial [Gammaproteobacteria bacterium]|nr:hypothetical protein [Gammaproteobacteria bacterium]
ERPRYVLEIRSPETLRGDAGEKKAAYFGLASIESYLQSRQSRLFVTVNRRTPGSSFWSEEVLEQPGNPMRLESLGSNSRSVRSTAAPPNAGYGRPAALSRPICHATALAAEDRQAVSALGLSGDLLASGAPEHHEPARRRRQPTVRPGVVRRGLRRSPAAMRYSSL